MSLELIKASAIIYAIWPRQPRMDTSIVKRKEKMQEKETGYKSKNNNNNINGDLQLGFVGMDLRQQRV
jgi:hypothetical protein